jgi:hypothetical protein
MRRLLLTMLLIVFFGTIIAQTSGELNVTVTTSEAGGNYAPRHVLAIWIEDGEGSFVKTLLAYAANRITHLNTWQAVTNNAGSQYNTVDAITGATKNSHATRTCSWDGTDYLGSDMPDGDYQLWMELTDKNSTGNYASFSFAKSSSSYTISPDNAPSFSNVQIEWNADQVGVRDIAHSEFTIAPNPGGGLIKINNTSDYNIVVYNLAGKVVKTTYSNMIDISNEPNGIYLVHIGNEATLLKYVKLN